VTALLNLRSAPSGALFVAENDGDTIVWNAAAQKWTTGPGGGGGAVNSVFGRTGVVVAATGDYDSDQVDNVSGVTGSSVSDALDTLSAAIAALGSDDIANDSSVSGTTVSDALDALLALLGFAGLKVGPLLTDANGTLSLTDGSLFVLPAATLTAPRAWTIDRNGLPGTTPGNGSVIYFLCLDTTANTKTITNGGAGGGNPMVVNNSAPIRVYIFIDDGTNWNYVDMALVQV
jgi:hypothetical protein